MNNFKVRLRELRSDEKLKQSEVAEKLKIPEATYSNWEQGRREPSIDGLIMLANFFGVTVGYLVGAED